MFLTEKTDLFNHLINEYSVVEKLKRNIKKNILSGIIIIVPVIITLAVLKWLINFFDGLIKPLIQNYIHIYIPGLGIVVSIVFIYLIGIFTKNYFGNKLVRIGEWFLVRIPVAKTIYIAVKQIIITLTTHEKKESQKVVLIEYPRKGIYSVGFLNGRLETLNPPTEFGSVLIITSINPTSGFTVFVPISEIKFTNLSVEQAMKLIVSGGIVLPEKIKIISQTSTQDN